MCGFAFIIEKYDNCTKNTPRSFLKYPAYRGRDQENSISYRLSNGWTLTGAHYRLIIQGGATAGMQPMTSESYIIFYNGEIFNHFELRAKHQIQSDCTSDSTTLQLLLEKKGTKILDELLGMFAIAVFDKKATTLTLVRDEFGEKPLFYRRTDNNLIVSSTLPISQSDISIKALSTFFTFGFVTEDQCIYKDWEKVQPNTNFTFDFRTRSETFSSRHAIPKTQLTLKNDSIYRACEAVSKQIVLSDVKSGLLLSGGIDSSLAAYFVSKQNKNLSAYTAVFDEHQYDERKLAEKYCDILKINQEQILISETEVIDSLKRNQRIFDEPFYDFSSHVLSVLLAKIPESIKVLHSGDGADEFFGGYTRHSMLAKSKIFRRVTGTIFHQILNVQKRMPLLKKIEKYLNIQHAHQKLYKISRLKGCDETDYLALLKITSDDILSKSVPYLQKVDLDLGKSFLENDINFYLPSDIFVKSDRIGMLHQKEIRSLFVLLAQQYKINDKDIINTVRRSGRKPALKSLHAEIYGSIGPNVKKGFTFPLSEWMRGKLGAFIESEVMINQELHNFVNIREFSNLMKDHRIGKFNYAVEIWLIYCFSIWMKREHETLLHI